MQGARSQQSSNWLEFFIMIVGELLISQRFAHFVVLLSFSSPKVEEFVQEESFLGRKLA
jgi:hypothetical protein